MSQSPIEAASESDSALEQKLAAALDRSAYGVARSAVLIGAVALSIFAGNYSGLPLITKMALGLVVVLAPWLAFEQWVLRRQLACALRILARRRGL